MTLGMRLAVPLAALLLSGCAAIGGAVFAPSGKTVATTTESSVGRTSRAAKVPATKVVVFVVENHSLRQMRSGMPFVNDLASRYGYTTHYRAITHPSLPNYLAIIGGSTSGVVDDDWPSEHPIPGISVFGQALATGRTAATYAEGMPQPCAETDGGLRYAVRHNPWVYYVDERPDCLQFDLSMAQLGPDVAAGTLPNVGLVIPDLCHDAHDCRLGSADAWLRKQVRLVKSGPDWAAGRLAIVITADEDDHSQNNRVLTVVAHPSIHHAVVRTPLTHYALSRSLSLVAGGEPLGHASTAPSLLAAFGVLVPPSG